jgi:CRP/FNR family transcriptional regulator, cyclic AMP receptor protein
MATDAALLKDFSCFRDLTDDQINKIAQFTNAVCYPPKHVLFEEGQAGERIYFLVNGEVEVLYRIGEDGMVPVDIVCGEEVVGCTALVDPYTYAATERSLSEIEVLEVDTASLRALMQQDLELGYKIQQHIIEILMGRITNLRLQ